MSIPGGVPIGSLPISSLPAATYTLALDGGVFSLSGSAAVTAAERVVVGSPAGFSVSGSSATTKADRILLLSSTSLSMSGSAAGTSTGRALVGGAGSIATSGAAAITTAARTVVGASGSLAMAGSAASTSAQRNMQGAAGSLQVNGSAAGTVAGRQLVGSGGSFALAGQAATTRADFILQASSGSLQVSGSDASLVFTPGAGVVRTLALDAGAINVTGSSVTTRAALSLMASSGALNLSGSDADLERGVPAIPDIPVRAGGGGAHWWRGKYRGELRRAIESAVRAVNEQLKPRRRKRATVLKSRAQEFVRIFDIAVPAHGVFVEAPELGGLEIIRRQILDLSRNLAGVQYQARRREEERLRSDAETSRMLKEAFLAYLEEVRRIEQREDEDVISIIMALDAQERI
jgi:hypothetical protein